MLLNTMRQRIGLPLVELPPTDKIAVTFTRPAVRLTAAAPATLTLKFAADTWNAAGGGILVSGSKPFAPGQKTSDLFNPVAALIHPGTEEITVPYPTAVASGQRVKLRLHATAPGGRQSMVVRQDVVAEGEH